MTARDSEILSGTVLAATASELPSAGRCLSQGAVLGAFIAYLFPLLGLFSTFRDDGYDSLIVYLLPFDLAAGTIFGLFMGTVIWAATHVIRQRLHPLIRVFITTVVISGIFVFVLNVPLSGRRSHPIDYLVGWESYLTYGVLFGLFIGSRYQPVHELIRGTASERWPVMNAITGLLLRIVVVMGWMQSLLYVIFELQRKLDRVEFVMAIIAFIHFSAAVVIVFARLPFWLLLPLAIIINFPIAAFVTDVLTERDALMRTITLNYLVLWAAFLSCRWSVPSAIRSFIKDKFHYYLGGEE